MILFLFGLQFVILFFMRHAHSYNYMLIDICYDESATHVEIHFNTNQATIF